MQADHGTSLYEHALSHSLNHGVSREPRSQHRPVTHFSQITGLGGGGPGGNSGNSRHTSPKGLCVWSNWFVCLSIHMWFMMSGVWVWGGVEVKYEERQQNNYIHI